MLFKVYRSDSSQKPSYLFGTLHAKSKGAYHFYEQARSCLNDVKIFAAEIDLKDPLVQNNAILFRLPQDKPLSFWMNQRQFDRVRKQLIKSFGVDIQVLRYFQPTYILSNISVNLLDNDYEHALDYQLFLDADNLDLVIDGLELIPDQYKLIELLDVNIQTRQLRKIAANPAHFRHKTRHQEEVYRLNDIQRLYHLGRNALGHFRRPLLKDRNIKMTERFINLMSEGPVFGAVGASHLGGQFGVLSLLRSAGFKVKRAL